MSSSDSGGTGISNARSASTSTFVAALIFNAAVFAAEIGVFTLIRPYFKAIYEPRTYAPPKSRRIQPLSANIILWPLAVWRADYRAIIKANGLDAYFFLRFLRMMLKIFVPIWIISWAVLLPVDSIGNTVPGHDKLDRFTFGNIQTDKHARYWAHLILAYAFTAWILYNIKGEMRHFVITRQHHLIDPIHAKSVQANTLLVTGIPSKYLTPEALSELFGGLPGGVKKIWINRNLRDLPDIYSRRMDACNKLESAETKLLAAVTKHLASKSGSQGQLSQELKNREPETISSVVPEELRPTHKLGFFGLWGEKVDTIKWAQEEIRLTTEMLDEGRVVIERELEEENAKLRSRRFKQKDKRGVMEDDAKADEFTSAHQQDQEAGVSHPISETPRTHEQGKASLKHAATKVGSAGHNMADIVGRTGRAGLTVVDTVVKERLPLPFPKHLTGKVSYPPLNSAFITFNRQIAAHLGMQVLAHHDPYRMSGRYVEVNPRDIIWGNLGLNPYEMKIRTAISWGITGALVVLWAFPVAFIGALSNIYSICTTYSWLGWLCKLPPVIIGIISGILPPILLAVLNLLLPIVLRILARFEGIPKKSGCELSLMVRFFGFQVLHSFLVVTLSSGIIASLDGLLHNPTSIPTLLAQNLPQASTFFLTYTVLQGFSGTAGGFLQIIPLAIYYIKLFILGSTPRSIYNIKYGKRGLSWGTAWPGITLLVAIALGYSIIAPIINGFACATFFAFYQLYKYLFLWQFDQSETADTGGLFFPRAITQVFVGLYIQEICLCALFFLARAVPEGALMVVLIGFTLFFQIIISNSYGPLLHALPLSLANKMYVTPNIPVAAPSERGESLEMANPVDTSEGAPLRQIESTSSYSHHGHRRGHGQGHASPVKDVTLFGPKKRPSEDEYGFAHPAASRPQRTIWLPKDQPGLAELEEKRLVDAGVDAAVQNAVMNANGKVDISGGPPDLIEEEDI